MALSFYDVSVASFLQTIDATAGFLDKAGAYFVKQGIDLEEVVETSLHPDMKPFRFQIRSVAHHSVGALEGLRSGSFSPPTPAPPYTYVQLQGMMADAHEAPTRVKPEEVEALLGRDVVFSAPGRHIPFKAENFILMFSLPNLHFHAATAYDILRQKGVPLEKRDFLGQLRIERGTGAA